MNIFNGPKMRQRPRHVMREFPQAAGVLVVCTCGLARWVPKTAVLTEREKAEAMTAEFRLLDRQGSSFPLP